MNKKQQSSLWQTAKNEVREIIISIAKARTTIIYGELAAMLQTMAFHPRAYDYHLLLREICEDEHAAGRGYLCALVVKKESGIPGKGYFRFLAQDGRDVSNPVDCWQDDIETIYAIWQD